MNRRQLKKKRTFKLHVYKTEEKLPEKSGKTFIWFDRECFTSANYSDKHKAFNCYDEDEDPQRIVHPEFWAYAPTL